MQAEDGVIALKQGFLFCFARCSGQLPVRRLDANLPFANY